MLYDDQFLGGLSIRGSRSTAYRHPPSCLINLSKRTHPTARTHNMAPFYQQSPDVRRNECTIVNTSGRLTAYNRHAAGTHSTQQHHVQQVLSRTEPLRTSSATGKCLSSNPSVTVVTRKGDQHTTHKPKNDQIKGYYTYHYSLGYCVKYLCILSCQNHFRSSGRTHQQHNKGKQN